MITLLSALAQICYQSSGQLDPFVVADFPVQPLEMRIRKILKRFIKLFQKTTCTVLIYLESLRQFSPLAPGSF